MAAKTTNDPNGGRFQRGEDHPRFKGGSVINEYGYVRVTVGRTTQKYEHRMVIEQLMLEQAIKERIRLCCEMVGDPAQHSGAWALEMMDVITNPPTIPPNMTVHHIDHNRQHNCPANLMLLDKALHVYITHRDAALRRKRERESMFAKLRNAGSTDSTG